MTGHDPYRPPDARLDGPAGGAVGDPEVTEAVLRPLRETRPWVTLLGVLGCVGGAFMVLGSLGMVAMGLAGGGEMGGGEAAIAGGVYLVLAGVYIAAAILLLRYSGAIGQLMTHGAMADLQHALNAQRIIWKTMGMLAVGGMVLGFLLAVGAGVAAFFMAAPVK